MTTLSQVLFFVFAVVTLQMTRSILLLAGAVAIASAEGAAEISAFCGRVQGGEALSLANSNGEDGRDFAAFVALAAAVVSFLGLRTSSSGLCVR